MQIDAAARTGRLRALAIDVSGALNLVGSLIWPLGLAFMFPAAIAVGYGEPAWPFLVSGVATASFGPSLERLTTGKGANRRSRGVSGGQPRLVGGCCGRRAALRARRAQLARPADAFFESMSGFSTTGASVVTDLPALSSSMAMWRQLTAWMGGLGIIVLFLAVLPRLCVGGRQALFRAETPGPELGLQTTIRETARRFVVLYVAMTAVGALALATLGWTHVDERMTLFNAVAHAFSTIATAGFSPEARSIEPFAPATQWLIVVFMIVAGTNFALLYAAIVRLRLTAFARDEEFRVYLVLLTVASLLVLIELAAEGILTGGAAMRHAVFNTVSMATTTGFASDDFNYGAH
jgi:trk system potassium uptake protein TrkH